MVSKDEVILCVAHLSNEITILTLSWFLANGDLLVILLLKFRGKT